ncbi:hypothetical protein HDU93_001794 [Gonapodya sp. JEL0774]|nr:hypothetical protein HDU93_001794 [Gonapodya sp. JEL0774]
MTPKVVTLWYRAPELLLGDKVYTTAVDMCGPTIRSHFPNASAHALNLLSAMLSYDPKRRISAADALRHEYFRENPRECHPSMIPSHPEIRNQKSEQSRLRHQQEEEEKKEKEKREREVEAVDGRRKQARLN